MGEEFKKYRKLPVVVLARQLGRNEAEIIRTLEGDMQANPGDFIIIGVNGERYPCKPDIFAKTYVPVDEEKQGDGERSATSMNWRKVLE
jgi:hypothetical protein